MKTLYRGVRLRKYELDELKTRGMRYYWGEPQSAISDIFRALTRTHKISRLGRSEVLRSLIIEASRPTRLQLWATDDKDNANSYSRHTPELIFLALDFAGVERKKVLSYLNSFYGKPHIVTFRVEQDITSLNQIVGNFVSSEQIIDVEPVDVTKPDPHMQKFHSNPMEIDTL